MTGEPPEILECEQLIEEPDESQWRQVHPRWVDGGVVSRDAFVGTSDDTERVSTARSASVSAEDAHRYYVETLGLASAGSWAVTVREIVESCCRPVDDGSCDDVETPAHSYIDMRGLAKRDKKIARAELAAAATFRGRQHP